MEMKHCKGPFTHSMYWDGELLSEFFSPCNCKNGHTTHYYRPQTKFAKVMFSQASFSHSVDRVVPAWQMGACVAKEGMHDMGGMCGKGGACVQERRPLMRAVHVLLECILVELFSPCKS